jgi:hypothetical protein
MLAILFEWLMRLPEEYILPPGAPDEFSGPAQNLENKPPPGCAPEWWKGKGEPISKRLYPETTQNNLHFLSLNKQDHQDTK